MKKNSASLKQKSKRSKKQEQDTAPAADSGTTATLKALTDLGNAERFIEQHGGIVRFCPELGKWLIYDQGRWQPDLNGMIQRLAHITVRRIEDEATKEGLSEGAKNEILKHSSKSASKGRINALLDIAKWLSGVTVRQKDLDTDPWLLNCLNGTLSLKTGELRTHNPEELITRMVEAPFDPDAKCPVWEAFIMKVMGGDQEKVGFLQRVFGYSLTGITWEQCMFILYGPGANGKTTFIEVQRDLLGDYATHTTTSSLLQSATSAIRNDLARLNSSRLVTAVEVGMGKRFDEALVKQLTGGDPVTARFLYREYFEYRPQFKLVIAANHKPEIKGVDHGIWRRIHLIPFGVTIPAEEIDKDLPAKLRAELPGILAWAIRGCADWLNRGLMVPSSIIDATAAYRAEMDVLENFIEDNCIRDMERRVPVGELYVKFGSWSESACQDVLGKKIFGNLMRQKGFTQVKSGDVRYWSGISVKEATVASGQAQAE